MYKIFAFAYLVRKHAKCYLVFLGIMHLDLMLNNLHASMDRMVTKKVYSLSLEKVGNDRLGERDLHPINPRTPPISNCFVI